MCSSDLCGDDFQRQLLHKGGGHARIYAPDGSELGTALPPDAEGLVLADIDLGLISLAKAAADPVGHYARPDVTRLLLNKTPGARVVHCGSSTGAWSEAAASQTKAAVEAAESGSLPE